MFTRFFYNLKEGLLLLFKPSHFKSKVTKINSEIDIQTGISIVARSVVKELESFRDKYPNDNTLEGVVFELNVLLPDDKEELKKFIKEKQQIMGQEEKYCPQCHRPYIYECNHGIKMQDVE